MPPVPPMQPPFNPYRPKLFPFDDLPEDLARLIIEEAVADPDAPEWSFACVSKAVRGWVEPILYRRVVLKTPLALYSFQRTLNSHPSKRADFFATSVKSFWIGDPKLLDLTIVFDILSTCSGVTALSWCNFVEAGDRRLSPFIVVRHAIWETLRLKRLSIATALFAETHRHFSFAAHWGPGKTRNPVFRGITHLDLSTSRRQLDPRWSCGTLSCLKALTHLCFSSTGLDREYKNYIHHNLEMVRPHFPPSLIVCVFSIPYETFNDTHRYIPKYVCEIDPRVVIAIAEHCYRRELERSFQVEAGWVEKETIWRRGGEIAQKDKEAFWERAVALVHRRKEGLKG
ncbi:hypothetical protein D9611_008040 [Ephemerocybe angulata]|uniref:Uncharacterized protein n=1 Tax=Ephemerocybe angulata TaxID=980116 RepID=A0A8H5C0V1_9AGAR|nr:hypothetical protein D9611_008040 [Tulosesus angulatus]